MKWCIALLVAFGVGKLVASEGEQGATLDDSRELVAQNRTCAVEIPNDWIPVADQTGRSVISVGNLVRGQYLSISVVDKDDFDGSLADVLSQAANEIVVHLESRTQSQPVDCQVGSNPAQQLRITGSENRFKFIYTLTVVETKTHYYRILTFTRPSTEREAREVFAKVLSTFKPLDSQS